MVAVASSGHKGYCLAAMVDILCAVLSGGNWGPTVDGFTTNKNYGDATKDKHGHANESKRGGIDSVSMELGISLVQ